MSGEFSGRRVIGNLRPHPFPIPLDDFQQRIPLDFEKLNPRLQRFDFATMSVDRAGRLKRQRFDPLAELATSAKPVDQSLNRGRNQMPESSHAMPLGDDGSDERAGWSRSGAMSR